MKTLIILLVATFTFTAQAGSIAWVLDESLIEGWDIPNIYFSQLHLFVVLDDNRQGIFDALENGTFNTSMSGVLDYREFQGSVPFETYYTPDNPDIVTGGEYSVSALVMLQLTPFGKNVSDFGREFFWFYHLPTTVYADGTSPVSLPYFPPVGYPYVLTGFYYRPIPEPATGLLALGGIALLLRRKRKPSPSNHSRKEQ